MTAAMIIIIVNLVILECLLSIDNAAVLAVMVKDLPGEQSKRALKWGMWGAYIGRGLCLLFASVLVKVTILKALGGLYLLWLAYSHFTKANDSLEEATDVSNSKIFGWSRKYLGLNVFWSTVVLVEIMDLAFSIDNVFAAVALSNQFWVIFLGVVVGITAMRFVSVFFLNLMKKYPSLEGSAFIVIGLLGIKLILSTVAHWWMPAVNKVLENHTTDLIFSGCMILIFFVPLLLGRKDVDKDPETYLR